MLTTGSPTRVQAFFASQHLMTNCFGEVFCGLGALVASCCSASAYFNLRQGVATRQGFVGDRMRIGAPTAPLTDATRCVITTRNI